MNGVIDVLVVEDERVVIDAARRILSSDGMKVDAVNDALAALDRIQTTDYRIILTDLMLPGMSGLEFIVEAKKLRPNVPVIMITGYATSENAVIALATGAFDFIPKPFTFEEMLGVIRRALKHAARSPGTFSRHPPLDADETERFSYYLLGDHSWAKLERDGSALLGAASGFSGNIEKIQSVEFPPAGEEVIRGRMCARFFTNDDLAHTVWAPLSGNIIECNNLLEKNFELINVDPFARGWLVRLIPTNLQVELLNLNHLSGMS